MNADEFNEKFMKGRFRKIYPAIAEQIVQWSGKEGGLCIDLGGGPGMLGISVALITKMHVVVCDPLKECIDLAMENIRDHGLQFRVTAVSGKAEAMPFSDSVADLVVSRGSIFFWDDQPKGLSEVYRVLKPGGHAVIGGGFGSVALLQEIREAMADEPDWEARRRERVEKNPPARFEAILKDLAIPGFIDQTEAGTWIHMRKDPGRAA
ncbi:class I SAM-dependent methyltransferase [Chlorobium sp. N1]|uniref:class I SAM-dependent methyltransferase n=1 Tax=Chlorobium sp. N1 TaxID=2491138 RepID=UPI001F608D16|nr:class I SAM-dependent methyltransferase [Chlorobium sp. N1]